MDTLRKKSFGMLIMLAAQYALGMYTNLFVQFPETRNEEALWKFAWTQAVLAGHIVLGFGLLAGSVAFLVTVLRQKVRKLKPAAVAGVVCILGAVASGALFVDMQNGLYSFCMAVFFLGAFAAYAFAAFVRDNNQ